MTRALDEQSFNPTDASLSFALPSEYYTSADIYATELEKVFARSWNFACHASQVAEPGRYVRCHAGEEGILVDISRECFRLRRALGCDGCDRELSKDSCHPKPPCLREDL